MSEKGALKNKKIEVIALVILAAFIVALGFLVYRYNKNKDFIYEKHLQENVITINSENITLKDFSYYVYVVEKKINEMALQYNPYIKLKILIKINVYVQSSNIFYSWVIDLFIKNSFMIG